MGKFEQKQPTTKRECMIFEIADTEAKYVASLAQVVEGYMAVTMGSGGGVALANDFINTSTGGGGNVNGGSMGSGSSCSNSISIPTDLADRLHIVWGNIRQIYEWHRNTLFPNLGAACYSNNILDVANCFIRHVSFSVAALSLSSILTYNFNFYISVTNKDAESKLE